MVFIRLRRLNNAPEGLRISGSSMKKTRSMRRERRRSRTIGTSSIQVVPAREWRLRRGSPTERIRRHSALGYRPPAPETIIQTQTRPMMHYRSNRTSQIRLPTKPAGERPCGLLWIGANRRVATARTKAVRLERRSRPMRSTNWDFHVLRNLLKTKTIRSIRVFRQVPESSGGTIGGTMRDEQRIFIRFQLDINMRWRAGEDSNPRPLDS